ncbi:IclR family transcriptional regulator [Lysinibacillus yapensis]|uniref:IclR family transcriptional regulator n=1 Tax=Ureibacillus yapensis TaxID=2304605 RepID=UPI001314DA4C|nr:IclR family transcriptional regulator [Lysinibacillus yapensis]
MKHSLDDKYFVVSVKNALRILRQFTPKLPELGISDIAERIELPSSTVHRLVKELEIEGFLVQNSKNKKYRLGLSIITLGGIVQSHQEIYEEAKPILANLASEFLLPAHICVMEHHKVVYLLREMGEQPVKLITKSGRYNDLHCTAEGLAILAFKSQKIIQDIISKPLTKYTDYTITDPKELKKAIQQIRYKRFAIQKDTFDIGYISFAVPIQDYTGEVVSSLALIGHSKYVKESQYKEIFSRLQKEAKVISEMLGYYEY